MTVPTIAAAVDTYSQYILDWAMRKKFREVCRQCAGSRVVTLGDHEAAPIVPCPGCDGRGTVGQTFGDQIALIHSEVSELLEAHRGGDGELPDKHCPEFTKMEVEAADAVIRLLDLSAAYNLRLGAAIEAKMAFNETRPAKHGKRY